MSRKTLEFYTIETGRYMRLVVETLTGGSNVYNVEIDAYPGDRNPLDIAVTSKDRAERLYLMLASNNFAFSKRTSPLPPAIDSRPDFNRPENKRKLTIVSMDLVKCTAVVAVSFLPSPDPLEDHPQVTEIRYRVRGLMSHAGPTIEYRFSKPTTLPHIDDVILINAHLERIGQALEVARANNELTEIFNDNILGKTPKTSEK